VAASWYRCPNCGQASPDCFDEEGAETVAWMPDQVPCDTCGSHDVVLCPHCHRDYDPLGNERIAVPAGAPPEMPVPRAPAPHPHTWPPRS
jgi:predicted RNA-binding Zn-ribbon protein involved in translation (DUF1610 family)